MKNAPLHQIKEDEKKVERAFLIGVQTPETSSEDVTELLDELGELSITLGLEVIGYYTVRLRKQQSRYLVGSGKAQEIVDEARRAKADVIVFDEELSPSQQRNWEKLAKMAVIDRQEVILDIFLSRAQTREAALQVSLAQAEYELPRLKRRWTHLSRQRGTSGVAGLRGEGEQQIEVDYRLVQSRISRLKQQLEEVRKQRAVQRSKRLQKPVPVAAIVGYTNAGKSSLLNAMTKARVFVENKLFATLDPTVRRIVLPNQQELLLSDTVGFIRKLPHLLIEAFNATLEETLNADFLVEVIDVSSNQVEEHHRTTRKVLAELGAEKKPVLTVFNKVDLLADRFALRRLKRRFPDAVFVSAKTGEGLDLLVDKLSEELDRSLEEVELVIPHTRYDLVNLLHRTSHVKKERYTADGILLEAAVPRGVMPAIANFFAGRNEFDVDSVTKHNYNM